VEIADLRVDVVAAKAQRAQTRLDLAPKEFGSRPARWPMARWLTVYYTAPVFVLLAAASALLYWGLRRNLLQQDEDFLAYKVQVLTVLVEHHSFDRSAVDQEVLEEAEISSRGRGGGVHPWTGGSRPSIASAAAISGTDTSGTTRSPC